MSRHKWALIKQSKTFYVRGYRKIIAWLLFLSALNLLLGLAIAQVYLSRKVPNFYATYGETPPIQLQPLNQPNYSATPILPEDINVLISKTVPQ